MCALAVLIAATIGVVGAGSAQVAGENGSGQLFLPMIARSGSTAARGVMVLIPGGTFRMGCDGGNDSNCVDNELPLHTVNLKDFFIDKNEVTNARYKACVDAGACTAPHDRSSSTRASYYGDSAFADFPVIRVDWFQAQAFCVWDRKRLPTEAEWEKAARGAGDTRVNPWGNALPDCTKTNSQVRSCGEYCVGDTTRVGSYPAGASPYGVMDLSGNVWEWASDWYDYDYYSISPSNNPTGPTTGEKRVIRGGCWDTIAMNQRVANRSGHAPNLPTFRIGLRCARSVEPDNMVLIPAGSFQMGCDSSNDPNCGSDETPLHTVNLSGYYIDKYEVTNARYKACVDAGVCTAPYDASSYTRSSYYGNPAFADYPAINVIWNQAQAFCAWEGKRLPTEAEWEKAARGAGDTRIYPWGNAAPTCASANWWGKSGGCAGDTSQVGSFPAGANPNGVMDMSGNVWEWVSDWYGEDYYGSSPTANPTGPASGATRVLRGGSWGDGKAVDLRVANRHSFAPNGRGSNVGFRCVLSQ